MYEPTRTHGLAARDGLTGCDAGLTAGDVWLRLGEVRIALGKLDEAVAALRAALEGTDPAAQPLIQFLLAAAHDRARRPADAAAAAAEGVHLDRNLSTLLFPALPPISDGEGDYLLGLAYAAEPVRPELAIVYFRRFLAAAPTSPWRRRAEEHAHALGRDELPESITRTGTAALDLASATAVVRKAMPALRACLTSQPLVVVEVSVSHAGPRTPPTDRLRPRFFTPPDGVAVRRALGELSELELAALDRCLSPIAAAIPLPPAKERDTYYKLSFHVVGP